MAGAEVIGAAISILLLILVGYIMVGSTLSSAEIVASAQKDLMLQNEARLRTEITIPLDDITIEEVSSTSFNLKFNLKNLGNEVVGDFKHMDVILSFSSDTPIHYKFNEIPKTQGYAGDGTWGYTQISSENIHPGMLDPNEIMLVEIDGFDSIPLPLQITMITPNGAQATQTKLP